VVKRRIEAYESIEKLVIWLKTSMLDTHEKDDRPYHLLFCSKDGFDRAHELTTDVTSRGLWITDAMFAKVQEFNRLIFKKPADVVRFGKDNYEKIATLRAEIERLLARDMLKLHDVKGFLKSKDKPDSGFEVVHLER
jgi:hypothetical protein